MAEIVNLRQAKKRAARRAASTAADANAAKYGRTKAERALEKAQADKAKRDLDGHRRDATKVFGHSAVPFHSSACRARG